MLQMEPDSIPRVTHALTPEIMTTPIVVGVVAEDDKVHKMTRNKIVLHARSATFPIILPLIASYNRLNMAYQGRQPTKQLAAHNAELNTWYPNSGATHHITNDLANLSIHSDYSGPDRVTVGDGTGFEDKASPAPRNSQ